MLPIESVGFTCLIKYLNTVRFLFLFSRLPLLPQCLGPWDFREDDCGVTVMLRLLHLDVPGVGEVEARDFHVALGALVERGVEAVGSIALQKCVLIPTLKKMEKNYVSFIQ